MLVKEVVGSIRTLLGRPGYGPVPTHLVLEHLYNEMDHQRNQMNLPNQGWFLSRQNLDVTPDTDEFPISALVGMARFIPLLITTKDDSDPYHVRREIPIVTAQNMDIYYLGPKTSIGTPLFPHVASSFTFFTDQNTGQFKAKVTPQHSQTASYDIWYQPDRPLPPGFTAGYPLLEAFTNLIKVATAVDLLPYTLEKDNSNQVWLDLLGKSLLDQRERYDRAFQIQKQMSFGDQKGPRRGFACDDEMTYGVY